MSGAGGWIPFALRRWAHRWRWRLLAAYLLTLLGLNLLVVAWPSLNERYLLEARLARSGQARWLPEFEATLARAPGLPLAERIEVCARLLREAPPAQLREILGRLRQEVGLILARGLLEAGRAEEAEALAAELVARDSEDYRLAEVLGDVRWARGERAAAQESYARALLLRPQLVGVVTRLCAAELEGGRPAAAWAIYERYRDALWVEEAQLGLRLSGGDGLAGPLSLPVVVDGRSHTYPLRLDATRLRSPLGGSPWSVTGVLLRLPPRRVEAEWVAAGLELTLPRRGALPPAAPLGRGGPDPAAWAAAAQVPSGWGSGWRELPLALPPTRDWGELRLTLQLAKPLPPELRAAARAACQATGRALPTELVESPR